jgi:hypothetical protein
MDWVTKGIAIGSRQDTMDGELVERAGIGAILQLYGPEREQPELSHAGAALCLYVVDGEPLAAESIRAGVDFIRAHRLLAENVLVACGAGNEPVSHLRRSIPRGKGSGPRGSVPPADATGHTGVREAIAPGARPREAGPHRT